MNDLLMKPEFCCLSNLAIAGTDLDIDKWGQILLIVLGWTILWLSFKVLFLG